MGCACETTANNPLRMIELPDGAAGTREVLKHMRGETRKDKRKAEIRHVAQLIVRRVPAKNWTGEIAAVFNFVRARIRYSLDTNGIEVVQSASVTLQLGYGDCDDLCVLLATLLECLGHVCYFCAMGFEERGSFSHVIVLCSGAGETELIALDPTESHAPGWIAPGATCLLIAPIEG